MKAIIMAGGAGQRLRPLTCTLPKPMVPVMNVPVMEYTLRLLRAHGITKVSVTLQYLPRSVQSYFGDGSDLGMQIDYVVEDSPLGTGGQRTRRRGGSGADAGYQRRRPDRSGSERPHQVPHGEGGQRHNRAQKGGGSLGVRRGCDPEGGQD